MIVTTNKITTPSSSVQTTNSSGGSKSKEISLLAKISFGDLRKGFDAYKKELFDLKSIQNESEKSDKIFDFFIKFAEEIVNKKDILLMIKRYQLALDKKLSLQKKDKGNLKQQKSDLQKLRDDEAKNGQYSDLGVKDKKIKALENQIQTIDIEIVAKEKKLQEFEKFLRIILDIYEYCLKTLDGLWEDQGEKEIIDVLYSKNIISTQKIEKQLGVTPYKDQYSNQIEVIRENLPSPMLEYVLYGMLTNETILKNVFGGYYGDIQKEITEAKNKFEKQTSVEKISDPQKEFAAKFLKFLYTQYNFFAGGDGSVLPNKLDEMKNKWNLIDKLIADLRETMVAFFVNDLLKFRKTNYCLFKSAIVDDLLGIDFFIMKVDVKNKVQSIDKDLIIFDLKSSLDSMSKNLIPRDKIAFLKTLGDDIKMGNQTETAKRLIIEKEDIDKFLSKILDLAQAEEYGANVFTKENFEEIMQIYVSKSENMIKGVGQIGKPIDIYDLETNPGVEIII